MTKHFEVEQDTVDAEAALDGLYVPFACRQNQRTRSEHKAQETQGKCALFKGGLQIMCLSRFIHSLGA
jgi:hypothetical protein